MSRSAWPFRALPAAPRAAKPNRLKVAIEKREAACFRARAGFDRLFFLTLGQMGARTIGRRANSGLARGLESREQTLPRANHGATKRINSTCEPLSAFDCEARISAVVEAERAADTRLGCAVAGRAAWGAVRFGPTCSVNFRGGSSSFGP